MIKHFSELTKNYLDRFEDPRSLETKILENLAKISNNEFWISRSGDNWEVELGEIELGKDSAGRGKTLIEASLEAIKKYGEKKDD